MDKGGRQKAVQRVKTVEMWLRVPCDFECQGKALILMMHGEILKLFFHGVTHDQLYP